MARKADQKRLEALQQAIGEHPGKRSGFFAKLFGWHCEIVNRLLVTLNDNNVLLYEDDDSGLWTFDPEEIFEDQ